MEYERERKREKVLVQVGVYAARTAVKYSTKDRIVDKTERISWYEKALDGRRCAHFFVDRISGLVKNDEIIEEQFDIVFKQWLKVPNVFRALSSMATVKMIDQLFIPIGYYPELVDKIKENCKKIIKENR